MGSKSCGRCAGTGFETGVGSDGMGVRDYNSTCMNCGGSGQIWVNDPIPRKPDNEKRKPDKSPKPAKSGGSFGQMVLGGLALVFVFGAMGQGHRNDAGTIGVSSEAGQIDPPPARVQAPPTPAGEYPFKVCNQSNNSQVQYAISELWLHLPLATGESYEIKRAVFRQRVRGWFNLKRGQCHEYRGNSRDGISVYGVGENGRDWWGSGSGQGCIQDRSFDLTFDNEIPRMKIDNEITRMKIDNLFGRQDANTPVETAARDPFTCPAASRSVPFTFVKLQNGSQALSKNAINFK